MNFGSEKPSDLQSYWGKNKCFFWTLWKGSVTRAFGNHFRRIDSLCSKVLTNFDRFDGILMDSMNALQTFMNAVIRNIVEIITQL